MEDIMSNEHQPYLNEQIILKDDYDQENNNNQEQQ